MSKTLFRIGQIVPSSNTTMETEIPAMLTARQQIRPERFTFHSSRMRMKRVVKEELAAMDAESDRCAVELSDARVDVLGYACLVAIMAMGRGYHRQSESRLQSHTAANGADAPVITSAGALIEGLKVIGAKRVVVVAPYMKPLTELVVDYIRHEGFEVADYRALEIPDNLEVARHDPENLPAIVAQMDTSGVDAIVLSACVQMPSLAAIAPAEQRLGLPVISAASCTVRRMLLSLGLEPIVPNAGAALSAMLAQRPVQAAI
jgi:maleate isomerase